MAKLQKGINDLKTWCLNNGDFGTQLMQEWTGDCEDGKHYEIDGVSFGSKKKFKWRCKEGHEWVTNINCRTAVSKNCCPYCSGRRVSDKNSLKTWSLSNGDFGTRLMQEWTGDCEDGKHYEIDEVSRCNGRKKFKWRCSEGHEWYTTVDSRTRSKCGCPACYKINAGSKISAAMSQKGVNDLKTWCLNNGDFGQQLIQEWTGECKDGKHYKIDEVARGSHKKFKWKCSEGHEWFALVNSRTEGHCCPYCLGRRVSDKNNLKKWCLSNGKYGQQLLQEWTGVCEDGKHYEIDEVSFLLPFSSKKMYPK